MAQISYPNSAHNARAVTEAEYEQLARATEAVGIIGLPDQTTVIYADSSGRQVKLRANKSAQVRGFHWDSGTTDTTFAIAANAGATRLDLVVLRLTRSTWQVAVAVVTGVSGSPAPSPTQDLGTSGVYELPLAIVTVPNGAATTTAGQVLPVETYLGAPPMSFRDDDGEEYLPTVPGALAYRESDDTLLWRNQSGLVTLGADSTNEDLTPASGWAASGLNYRRLNGIVYVTIKADRTGGASGASLLIATLPAGFRPSVSINTPAYITAAASESAAVIVIETNGEITLGVHFGVTATSEVYAHVAFPAA